MESFQFDDGRLKDLGVVGLFLFGSRAQGVARETSDYDVGVLLADQKKYLNRSEKEKVYYKLYDMFSDSIKQQVNIDIVFLDFAPAELQMHVVKYGRLLFTCNPKRIADFRQRVMEDYADFAPYRDQFQQATLARI